LTGTRADYGKLKSLIKAVSNHADFEPYIYVTGMHMLKRYGYTAHEVMKDNYKNIYMNINQHVGDAMEIVLANTVKGLSHYVHQMRPDMLVIHGDRVEALAGAIVGALTNTLVAHIEGGELSGTIDDSIRHSISKMAHVHFVCNKEASDRLHRMGENKANIYEIGSPDYDLMFSDSLPELSEVLDYYKIPFDEFGIILFHPVTTDVDRFGEYSKTLVEAVNRSGRNFVAIYPNNDQGSDLILDAYAELDSDRIKLFPSLSFERFIVLLKNCRLILGNSSAGIREAPCYGIPSLNVGDRQNKRFKHISIIDVGYEMGAILGAIEDNWGKNFSDCKVSHFGRGDSSEKFIAFLEEGRVWDTPIQKIIFDD
jgi:UDP-N-acetylglucosamine 2-epimerase (hydrolysing)